MTLKQFEDFRTQIQRQLDQHKSAVPPVGQELLYHLGAVELQVGLNLINQLITMETALLAAPPGATAPEI